MMKLMKKMVPMAVAATLSVPMLMTVAPASAEMSASFAASNMYLWRGQNLTKDGAAISGSLDYAHGSGFYAGAWTSTETAGSETDLYLGIGSEFGDFSFDVSYWKYLYPEERSAGVQIDLGDSDASEYVLSLGYGPVTATAYIAAESGSADNNYYTIAAAMDKFTLTYGFWDLEKGTIAGTQDEYSHIQLSYAATDELSFGVSIAASDLDAKTDAAAVEEDPLFTVTYSKSFDL